MLLKLTRASACGNPELCIHFKLQSFSRDLQDFLPSSFFQSFLLVALNMHACSGHVLSLSLSLFSVCLFLHLLLIFNLFFWQRSICMNAVCMSCLCLCLCQFSLFFCLYHLLIFNLFFWHRSICMHAVGMCAVCTRRGGEHIWARARATFYLCRSVLATMHVNLFSEKYERVEKYI